MQQSASERGGALDEATRHVKELEALEEYFFGPSKERQMREVAAAALARIEVALGEAGVAQAARTQGLFLKGRVASLQPGQERHAEELLSKALKLNPQHLEAWNALGEVYWNLQDFAQAKRCFEQALELCGPNPVSLRNLSMVLRAVDGCGDEPETAATRSRNYTCALQKAKEAVALDASDPQSWETLGNAYMGDFFVNGKRLEEINRALVAYEKAEASYRKLGKRNPTLHVNRGMAAKYTEDYELALRSFQTAHELGAAGAADEMKHIVDLLQRLSGYSEQKKTVKRLKELAAGFPEGARSTSFKELSAAEPGSCSLLARVGTMIDRRDAVPTIIGCYDAQGTFFALSLYNTEFAKVAATVVQFKTIMHIKNATTKQKTVKAADGKEWSYWCVRVTHPANVEIVGGTSLGVAAVQASFSTGVQRSSEDSSRQAIPDKKATVSH